MPYFLLDVFLELHQTILNNSLFPTYISVLTHLLDWDTCITDKLSTLRFGSTPSSAAYLTFLPNPYTTPCTAALPYILKNLDPTTIIMTSSTTTLAFGTVKVNVRLCGSVPRRELESLSITNGLPANVLSSRTLNTFSYLTEKNREATSLAQSKKNCIASELCSFLSNLDDSPCHRTGPWRPSTSEFEAPAWAVPAPGESRLEVCFNFMWCRKVFILKLCLTKCFYQPLTDSIARQSPVNLKAQAVFRVGRSPQSDIQLFHDNCSRRHAMLFHHDNGSCYLVDCGSAHGTFVNGNRVESPPNGGVVIPFKVRRGSIIRFGGPGAPQYMLKSFSFELDELREAPSAVSLPSPTSGVAAVVQHNTRFNSLGKTAKDSLLTGLSSKRSFDSIETLDSDVENKRLRCSSPPLSPEHHIVRLVSPDTAQPNKRRRVSFSDEPPKAFYPNLISPDLSSDENDEV